MMENMLHEKTPQSKRAEIELGVKAISATRSGQKPYDFDWREASLCLQYDPETFFPGKGMSVREAKKLCNRCPVIQQCLEAALSVDSAQDDHGVWGGKSESERRDIRRRRKQQAHVA